MSNAFFALEFCNKLLCFSFLMKNSQNLINYIIALKFKASYHKYIFHIANSKGRFVLVPLERISLGKAILVVLDVAN